MHFIVGEATFAWKRLQHSEYWEVKNRQGLAEDKEIGWACVEDEELVIEEDVLGSVRVVIDVEVQDKEWVEEERVVHSLLIVKVYSSYHHSFLIL